MQKLSESIDATVAGLATGRSFFISLAIILFIGLIFRVVYLPADPPVGISKSQDFSTDPPQYTYFAHHLIEQGDSNPYGDPRYSQWEYTTQNLLSIAVYAVLGTGRAQGNLVAVIFNLLSILLLALAMRNFGSRVGALFFALFAACDFTLVWFARTPFLEASQNFWICSAVYFYSLHKAKVWPLMAAGAACAIASFFGKMVALFMLGPFTALWIILFLTVDQERRSLVRHAGFFYGGFAAIVVVWFLAIWIPAQSEVGGYLAEQAFGLYGAPRAFDSVNALFLTFNSLLWERSFLVKMPITTILAFLGGCAVLVSLAKSGRSGRWFRDLNPGWVLITLWFLIGYLSLFPWNYRPLRYQTTIIFPALALAGFIVGYLWDFFRNRERKGGKKKTPTMRTWQVAVTWGLWMMPLLVCVLLWLGQTPQEYYYRPFAQSPAFYSILMLLAGAALGLLWMYISKSRLIGGALLRLAGLIVVLAFVAWNTASFFDWVGARQYSLLTADRDIGAITNEGAVLTGPYGPALSLNNERGTLMHMFGVIRVDKDLFDKYPITHLAMDESNEKQAREDYPEVMAKAWQITRYILRGVNVKVYNIAEGSTNPEANAYLPSDYELAQKYISTNNEDSAQVYMARFLESGVANFSADLYVADALAATGQFERAVSHYRKVQEFSPGEPLSALYMGNAMISLASSMSNTAWFDSALVYYKIAQEAYPNNPDIDNLVSSLERRTQ